MSTSPLSPEAVEVQAPPDLEFPELARPVKAEGMQYAGLTPVERALAEDDLHMSTCDEPSIDGCGDCQRKLARFRRLIEVVSPVIEADARADERRKVVAELVETLEGVYVGDPTSSLYIAGKSDGYLEAAGTVRHHYDDSDEPPVAAASNPTRPEGE